MRCPSPVIAMNWLRIQDLDWARADIYDDSNSKAIMSQRILASVLQIALVVLCPFVEFGYGCGECDMQVEQTATGCDHQFDEDCDHDDQSLPCNHRCPHDQHDSNCVCKGAVFVSGGHVEDLKLAKLCVRMSRQTGVKLALQANGRFGVVEHRNFLALSGWEIRARIESLLL